MSNRKTSPYLVEEQRWTLRHRDIIGDSNAKYTDAGNLKLKIENIRIIQQDQKYLWKK